jgi:hypothetical protein
MSIKKLNDVRPIWHAVIWIAAYVVLTNIGDGLSASLGKPNSATVPLHAARQETRTTDTATTSRRESDKLVRIPQGSGM